MLLPKPLSMLVSPSQPLGYDLFLVILRQEAIVLAAECLRVCGEIGSVLLPRLPGLLLAVLAVEVGSRVPLAARPKVMQRGL